MESDKTNKTENIKNYMKEYYKKNKAKYHEEKKCDICKKSIEKNNMTNHKRTKLHKINELEYKLKQIQNLTNSINLEI